MSRVRVCLEPVSPLYTGQLGRARKSGALVHSDTLHAALVSVAAQIGSPRTGGLEAARELRVSSVFPFWSDLYFYPRPFVPPPKQQESADPADRKRWKNVRLLSEGALRLWLAQDPRLYDEHVTTMPEPGFAVLQTELKGRPWPLDGLMKDDLSTAVTIDRISNAATPFERRCLRLNADRGCGMYFLADLDGLPADALRETVERLGERGLGGERGVGYGHFNLLRIEPIADPEIPSEPDAMFMTLSLYLPTEGEVAAGVLAGRAAYDTAIRGGWIHDVAGTGQRRRSLRMCLEGSVFPAVAATRPPRRAAAGEVRDCAPESFKAHPVWRSGLAFPYWFRRQNGSTES